MKNLDNRDAISYLAAEFTLREVGFPSLEWHDWYSKIITKAIKERGILIDGQLVFIDKVKQASSI